MRVGYRRVSTVEVSDKLGWRKVKNRLTTVTWISKYLMKLKKIENIDCKNSFVLSFLNLKIYYFADKR
jgi:hypothetical protein